MAPLPDSRPAPDEQRDLLASVVDAVGPLVVLAPDGSVVRANAAATGLTGYEEAFTAALAEGRSSRPPEWVETAAGRRLIAWRAAALRGDDGAVDHVVVEGLDLTDMQGGAEEAALAHEELRRRAAELEQANEDLNQFASIVSHDLREPLRVVSGVAELLETRYAGDLDDSAERLLGALTRSTERMSALLDGLLAYSRVGRIDEWRTIDLNALLGEVLEALGEQIADSGGEVVVDELPTVEGDWVQLAQLFQNLVANALKFRGDAPPRVHVRGRRENEGWHLEVADNGIGIDPRNRDRVFEMFQRLVARDAYPGTGVGLAIAKKIIDRHGGRIWVEPGAERGTTFHFTIAEGAGSRP